MSEETKALDGAPEGLEKLLGEVREAKKVLDQRIEEEKAANNRTTDARNVYNSLCKKFDAAVAKMKAEAPRGTDWRNQDQVSKAVPA